MIFDVNWNFQLKTYNHIGKLYKIESKAGRSLFYKLTKIIYKIFNRNERRYKNFDTYSEWKEYIYAEIKEKNIYNQKDFIHYLKKCKRDDELLLEIIETIATPIYVVILTMGITLFFNNDLINMSGIFFMAVLIVWVYLLLACMSFKLKTRIYFYEDMIKLFKGKRQRYIFTPNMNSIAQILPRTLKKQKDSKEKNSFNFDAKYELIIYKNLCNKHLKAEEKEQLKVEDKFTTYRQWKLYIYNKHENCNDDMLIEFYHYLNQKIRDDDSDCEYHKMVIAVMIAILFGNLFDNIGLKGIVPYLVCILIVIAVYMVFIRPILDKTFEKNFYKDYKKEIETILKERNPKILL